MTKNEELKACPCWQKDHRSDCPQYKDNSPTVAPIDGDAERGLEALEMLMPFATRVEQPTFSELEYCYKTIRTALQSTRTPPVDTINIKREVLQGVMEALRMIEIRCSVNIESQYDNAMALHKICSAREDATKALASLDAVLEGE